MTLADEQDEDEEEEESSGDEEEGQGDEGDGVDSDIGDAIDDEDDLGDPSKRWNGRKLMHAQLTRTFLELEHQ